MPTSSRMIPADLWLKIISYSTGNTILVLEKLNNLLYQICNDQETWKMAYNLRFGKSEKSGINDFRNEYLEKEMTIRSVVDSCSIVHRNGRYWAVNEDKDTEFGAVMRLVAVCWLDVQGVIPGVICGEYRAVWRIRLEGFREFENIDFMVKEIEESGNERVISKTRLSGANSWSMDGKYFDLAMPTNVVVERDFTNIKFECADHSNIWKSGLILSSIRLERDNGNTGESHTELLINSFNSELSNELIQTGRRPQVPVLKSAGVIIGRELR